MSKNFNQYFSVKGKTIGLDQPVFIVAEAGVAHFGSIDKAFKLVDMAVDAGVDAVKFQIFNTDNLISKESSNWRKRLRSRELPFEAFREIFDYCLDKSIIFFSTAHDEPSLKFLKDLDVPLYKIGSGEVSNWQFLKKVADCQRPVILSTGMYTMDDVRKALKVILETGNSDIAVLHCVTAYPTEPAEVNLNVLKSIKKEFGVITGFSDHTEGFHFPLAAVAMGAKIIEKHISLDFNIPDAQDWKVSCGPDELAVMVQQIREIEKGLGDGIKQLHKAEEKNLQWARKSLVAARDIMVGEIISDDLLNVKRPGTGIAPSEIGTVVGKEAKEIIPVDSLIKWEQLK